MAEPTILFQAGHPKNDPTMERRAWVRFPSDQEISCQQPTTANRRTADTAWLGRVRDISVEGISLSINRWFERGTMLIVELSAKAEELHHLVRVAHAAPERKGHWIVGCAFASPLSEQQFRDFIED
jgi:PilZ domain